MNFTSFPTFLKFLENKTTRRNFLHRGLNDPRFLTTGARGPHGRPRWLGRLGQRPSPTMPHWRRWPTVTIQGRRSGACCSTGGGGKAPGAHQELDAVRGRGGGARQRRPRRRQRAAGTGARGEAARGGAAPWGGLQTRQGIFPELHGPAVRAGTQRRRRSSGSDPAVTPAARERGR
jgi:hypothetical protein